MNSKTEPETDDDDSDSYDDDPNDPGNDDDDDDDDDNDDSSDDEEMPGYNQEEKLTAVTKRTAALMLIAYPIYRIMLKRIAVATKKVLKMIHLMSHNQ